MYCNGSIFNETDFKMTNINFVQSCSNFAQFSKIFKYLSK